MKQLLAVVFASVIFFGCKVDETTMATNPTTSDLTVYPSDNQTGVTQSTPITLTFSKAVDKSVVEKNFRLMNERSYMDSLCPVSKTMGHGSMTMSMMDSVKMNHLDSIHGLKGTFLWNSDGKSCSFIPDTLLYPGMQHMVHLREGMVKMMESNMGTMGMMGRSGTGTGMGMTFHFMTKSNSLGSGHESHHP
jgi:hypothetical protein